MSRSRYHQNDISSRRNSESITRVRSISCSISVHPTTIDNNFPTEQTRHGRRSVWTMVIIFTIVEDAEFTLIFEITLFT